MQTPPPTPLIDPGDCDHGSCRRLGVQHVPWKPHRIHLVLCDLCGTTISTEQLRLRRQEARKA